MRFLKTPFRLNRNGVFYFELKWNLVVDDLKRWQSICRKLYTHERISFHQI
jgi:hypothetical protein